MATENKFCSLFNDLARNQLQTIFDHVGPNIYTACQLKNRILELIEIQLNNNNIG